MASNVNLKMVFSARNDADKVLKSTAQQLKDIKTTQEKLAKTAKIAGAAMTGAAVLMGVNAFKAASSYDTLSRATNQMLKLNDDAFTQMKEDVRALSIEVGKDANEMQEAMYTVASAGFRGAESMKVLRVVGEAATAGLADASQVTKTLTKAMNIFGMEGDEAREAMDKMFGIVDAGLLNFEELASSFPRAATQAKTLGVSFDEVGAALATITKTAGSTEQAATAINGVFTQLVKPSTQLTKVLNDWGYESGQAAVEAIGLTGILGKLKDEYGNNTTALGEMFPNVRALMALFPLLGEGAEDYSNALDVIGESTNMTSDYFEDMAEGPGFKLNQAMLVWKDTMIGLGDTFAPMIEKIAKWVSANQDLIKSLVPTIFKITAIGGPILLLLGYLPKLISGFQLLSKGVTLFYASAKKMPLTANIFNKGVVSMTTSVAGLVAIIGAAVAAAVWMYDTYKKTIGAIDAQVESESKLYDMRIGNIKKYGELKKSEDADVRAYAEAQIELQRQLFRNQEEGVEVDIKATQQKIRDARSVLEEKNKLADVEIKIAGTTSEAIKEAEDEIENFLNNLNGAGGGISDLGDDIEDTTGKLKEAITQFKDDSMSAFTEVSEAILDINNKIKDLFSERQAGRESTASDTAKEFVNQEEKVADLKKQIGEEEDNEKKNQLQEQLRREEEALDYFSHRYRQYEEEIIEERKWRTKTDFEQSMIEIDNNRIKLNKEFEMKKKELEDELKLEIDKLEAINVINNIALAQQNQFITASENATTESINREIEKYNQLAGAIVNAREGNKSFKVEDVTTLQGLITSNASNNESSKNDVVNKSNTFNFNFSGSNIVDKNSFINEIMYSINRANELTELGAQ